MKESNETNTLETYAEFNITIILTTQSSWSLDEKWKSNEE